MPRPSKKTVAVREPVQVYLTKQDRALLDRVAKKAGLSRAEVLRRGLRRIGAEVLAGESPVLALLDEMAAADWPAAMPRDVAERHDRYLAETYRDTRESGERWRRRSSSTPPAGSPLWHHPTGDTRSRGGCTPKRRARGST
jgi:hypothetical protein